MLVLVASALCLVLVELVLRVPRIERLVAPRGLMNLEFVSWDAFHGNDLVAGYSSGELEVNSLGHRGPELDPARRRRIVCLGDSSTFGIRVERPSPGSDERRVHYDSYPAELQRLLDARGYRDWQVINAGVPGSTSLHSLRILRREVLPLEPEIVTLRVGMNDHAAPRAVRWVREPDSATWRAVFHLLGEFRLFQAGLAIFAREGGPRGDRAAISPEEFARALTTFAELSREHGFRLLLLDYPLGGASDSDPAALRMAGFYGEPSVDALYRTHARYQQVVRQVATSERIPLLATAPHLGRPGSGGFSDDFIHPDAEGMRKTSELLYDYFARAGWLAEDSAASGRAAVR